MSWHTLGSSPPGSLLDARLQLHHAALLAAAPGASFLEPRPDDSHPNLGWLPSCAALAGHRIPGKRPFQAALRCADATLLLLDAEQQTVDALALDGRSVAEALAWLGEAIGTRFRPSAPGPLAPPVYEIPPHAVATGARFSLQPAEAFAELRHWYANAEAVLESFVAATPGASEVRCWPHHFDLATLVAMETGPDGAATRTVGVGMSPGDGTYAEPYWYVTPWPYPPADAELPSLAAGGRWHREGYTAAILSGTTLIGGGPDEGQFERFGAFLGSAVSACSEIHGVRRR